MEFLSNENKSMLWELLQESNTFQGISNNKFNNIHSIFENTITNINQYNQGLSLLEKNKLSMEELIKLINNEKPKIMTPEPKIQMIYKAQDLKIQRENQFNIKLKQQEEDFNSIMNIRKPEEINFNDTNINDDKPIGDEMDRLIAERLASRERELEIPTITENAEKWINNTNNNIDTSSNTNNNIDTSSNISKDTVNKIKYDIQDNKKVTFDNNIHNIDTNYNSDNINNYNNVSKNNNEDSILNKLKRKMINKNNINDTNNNTNTNNNINDTNNNTITNNNTNYIDNTDKLINKLEKLEMQINTINDTQEKILEICKTLMYTPSDI